MKFLIITKQDLRRIPPLISVALILNDLGHDVHIISCGISDNIKEILSKRNITSEEYDLASAKKATDKIIQYIKFGHIVNQRIKHISFDYLWIEAGYTIRALGKNILNYKFILQLSELHEKSPALMKAISKVINKASLVFMPEYNRTFFYKAWFQLKNTPIVLPNKPYFIPKAEELLKLKDKYKELVSLFENNKIILYQGIISSDRDLSYFAEAIKKLGSQYKFVLMGKDFGGLLDRYMKINPNIIHIEFITPPDYLLFTSLCHIGIVYYNPLILNNAFCAPNKIYEYSAFGKPVIGNNIPGLKQLEAAKASVLVSEDSVDSIIEGIKKIELSYQRYSDSAIEFFESCHNEDTIANAINTLE